MNAPVSENDANATLRFFEDTIIGDNNVRYICVSQRASISGGEDWVIEIGVEYLKKSRFPSSLPIPFQDGTLSNRRIAVIVFQSNGIEAQY